MVPSVRVDELSTGPILTLITDGHKISSEGRKLYADLDKDTFMDFADELISEKNFLQEKQINGVKMVIPQWEHCLNYEQELRNEAIRLTMEEGYSTKAAPWTAYKHEHLRDEHWIMLIGVTNAHLIRGASDRNKLDQQLAQARSRSPGRNNQQAAPAPKKAGAKSNGKGKGKSAVKNQQSGQTSSSSAPSFRKFHELMKLRQAKKHFTKQPDTSATNSSSACARQCSRAHECIGCGREGVPHDDCGCAEGQF